MRVCRAAIIGWLLAAALLLVGCGGAPASPQPQANKTPEPAPVKRPAPFAGYPAPEIAGRNVFTGEKTQLSDLRGKVVLVNFWATWCPPCRQEMPDLQSLHQEMGDRLRIMALGGDQAEGSDLLAAYAKDRQLTFPVIYDQGQAAEAYKLIALPTSFLIDQNGIIREKIQGAMTLAQMREVVARTEAAGRKAQ